MMFDIEVLIPENHSARVVDGIVKAVIQKRKIYYFIGLEKHPLDSCGISETAETLQERSDEAARRSPRGKRAVSFGKPALSNIKRL
ncbi:hypothetical protein [Lederbergia citrea]|uniref:hypothetical protein n=1 Tax=Lederbergia citrea TaxID=2833581 RepID=UPI001BC98D99|nr:hypothetical protein [Lederbergia citrea]MBS4205224.1 hypothetical protein [Lederbergia citrea]